jgi:hypothetical protein
MTDAERDRAANDVVETRVTFSLALSDKRKSAECRIHRDYPRPAIDS